LGPNSASHWTSHRRKPPALCPEIAVRASYFPEIDPGFRGAHILSTGCRAVFCNLGKAAALVRKCGSSGPASDNSLSCTGSGSKPRKESLRVSTLGDLDAAARKSKAAAQPPSQTAILLRRGVVFGPSHALCWLQEWGRFSDANPCACNASSRVCCFRCSFGHRSPPLRLPRHSALRNTAIASRSFATSPCLPCPARIVIRPLRILTMRWLLLRRPRPRATASFARTAVAPVTIAATPPFAVNGRSLFR
jgi:hypothetical protein